MTCIRCKHGETKKFGFVGKRRIQRYRCTFCNSTFVAPYPKPFGNALLAPEKANQVLTLMLEGMSIRAISRVTGVDKNTILRLLETAGERARSTFDAIVRRVRSRHVQADEVWGFVHTKENHVRRDDPPEWGHTFIWVALDADSKLILSYHVGKRGQADAYEFIADLDNRVRGRFQLTTDGLLAYVPAVEDTIGMRVDYAQLVKVFATPKGSGPDWYGTGRIREVVPSDRIGTPDPSHICTSHIERSNLTLRMHLRRFTRLTNAHSKKLDNLKLAISLYFAWYNLCRVHQTLRVTPAMEAGLVDHIWSIEEVLNAGACAVARNS